MRRWIAVLWHASFLLIGALLYFLFVLPRWHELIGAWPVGVGSAMRPLCGAFIGLAALPVLVTLLKTRKPEFGTPQLALTLRLSSVVLHVLAGALIIGGAISEYWVTLDSAGSTLFGIYGAAASMALLGALGFYLAYAAELPPPPPKPLKAKRESRRRGLGTLEDTPEDTVTLDESAAEVTETTAPDVTPAPVSLDKPDETIGGSELTETSAVIPTSAVDEAAAPADLEETADDESAGTLRNRRPNGKPTAKLFGRSSR